MLESCGRYGKMLFLEDFTGFARVFVIGVSGEVPELCKEARHADAPAPECLHGDRTSRLAASLGHDWTASWGCTTLSGPSNYAAGMKALVTVRVLLERDGYYALGMDAPSSHMLSESERYYVLGYSGHRVLSEHESYHALRIYALVRGCSWSTNARMLWAWMVW